MSKTAVIFFTLLLVLACCYTAGCSVPSSSGAPASSGVSPSPGVSASSEKDGVSSGQGISAPGKRSLEGAVGYITAEWSDPQNTGPATGSQERHIRYIHGADFDEQGNAGSWIVVVERAGKSYQVTISGQDSTTSDAPGVAWTEINTTQIMYPRELIEKNHALIFNSSESSTTVSRSLSLEDGNYIVTLSGRNGQQTLVFNATTGALTP
jgi:hypothetical protein